MENFNTIPSEINNLIADYLLGCIDHSGMMRLFNWIRLSEENKLLFHQFNDIWQASASEKSVKADVQREWLEVLSRIRHKQSGQRKDTPHKSFRIRRIFSIAAAIAVIFTSGMLFQHQRHSGTEENITEEYIEMVAPLGSRAFVVLSDGSKVWLNAGTKLRYSNRFGEWNRNIHLEGEAYFDVAKRPEMPMIVNAADVKITALGTIFNVKAYTEEGKVETSLEEGSVSVERTGNGNNKKAQTIILHPNQKASLIVQTQINEKEQHTATTQSLSENGKQEIFVEKMDDIRISTSWKDNRWLIRAESLESLAVKLSRRYDMSFIFEDESLKQYHFSATLHDETLEQVLSMVQVSAPIKYTIKEKIVYLGLNPLFKETFEESSIINN